MSYFIGQRQIDLAQSCVKKFNLYTIATGVFLSLILLIMKNSLATMFFKDQIEEQIILGHCIIIGTFACPFYQAVEMLLSFLW